MTDEHRAAVIRVVVAVAALDRALLEAEGVLLPLK